MKKPVNGGYFRYVPISPECNSLHNPFRHNGRLLSSQRHLTGDDGCWLLVIMHFIRGLLPTSWEIIYDLWGWRECNIFNHIFLLTSWFSLLSQGNERQKRTWKEIEALQAILEEKWMAEKRRISHRLKQDELPGKESQYKSLYVRHKRGRWEESRKERSFW